MASERLPVGDVASEGEVDAASLRHGDHGTRDKRVRPGLRDDDRVLRPLARDAVAEVGVARRHRLAVDGVVGLARIHAAHTDVVVARRAATDLGIRRHRRAVDAATRRVVAGDRAGAAVTRVVAPGDTRAAAIVVAGVDLAGDLQRRERRALIVGGHVVHGAAAADGATCASYAACAVRTSSGTAVASRANRHSASASGGTASTSSAACTGTRGLTPTPPAPLVPNSAEPPAPARALEPAEPLAAPDADSPDTHLPRKRRGPHSGPGRRTRAMPSSSDLVSAAHVLHYKKAREVPPRAFI